jgi:hypothetical protein
MSGARSSAAIFLLVFALLWQGVAVQTHSHTEPHGSVRTGAAIEAAATGDRSHDAPDAPACPLCEEQALFGAYLLSGAVALVLPVTGRAEYAPVLAGYEAVRERWHAWRSRAPPLSTP